MAKAPDAQRKTSTKGAMRSLPDIAPAIVGKTIPEGNARAMPAAAVPLRSDCL
ncbi:hypothetical protein [Methylacidimicrobium sp. AP8]|uniref:hypothetical protein n=1 Tax=Methylacidimicrobium sp. AP8 TaxID=2730359 RepID=UPI0019223FDA|nr:hypothetical protein [Methylacidimicrobium sp. AP8]